MPSEFCQPSFKLRPEPAVKKFLKVSKNSAGFMTAEFLFAFTMVIGSGILIFGLTFALTTIEVAQYIVWSSARAYAAGNKVPSSSTTLGAEKYKNLTAAFPLLTGEGSASPWFKMDSEPVIGDLTNVMRTKDGAIDKDNAATPGAEARHPWIGVESNIDLILLKGLQVPFLGKVTERPEDFKFPIRAILFRHPSFDECQKFFDQKFTEGIKKIPSEPRWKDLSNTADAAYRPMEDNGC